MFFRSGLYWGIYTVRLNIFVLVLLFGFLCPNFVFSQTESGKFTITRVKYSGGGDWYSDPSSLPNLLRFIGRNTNIKTAGEEAVVALDDETLFSCPYLYITGHGNIRFTDSEVKNLRRYLLGGGFLHADDNYGMDKSFRREMKRVFPDKEFAEIPFRHKIYSCVFPFPTGLPKIHEHDGGPPHGYGLFDNGRLICFYSFNTDLGDGWEDADVHNDPEEKRMEALKMGTNIVFWALTH